MGQDADLRVRATQQGIPETKAEVDALRQSVAATNTEAGAATAAAAGKGEAGLAALRAEMKASAAEAKAVAEGETAAASATQSFGLAAAGAALPLVAVSTAVSILIALFPKLLELVESVSAGEANHTEITEGLARAQYALSQGFVVSTDNMTKNLAAIELHKAGLHGWTLETDAARAALEAFGLKLPPTFQETQQAAQAFFDTYRNLMGPNGDGAAYARAFLELNKSTLEQIGAAFAQLGKEAPADIQALAKSIGVDLDAAAKKSDETLKKLQDTIGGLQQKQKDLAQAVTDGAKAFQDASQKIEADRLEQIAAIEETTAKTVASLQAQVEATKAAYAAREISDTAYNTKINSLYAAEAKAKSDAYDEERAVDDKAKTDQDALTKKYQEESTKRQQALNATADAEKAATDRLDALNIQRDAEFRALKANNPLLGDSATLSDKAAASTGVLSDKFGELVGKLGPAEEALGGVKAQLDGITASALAAAAALDRVTGTGGGGTGSGAEAPGTVLP